jgi:hypothetical protein
METHEAIVTVDGSEQFLSLKINGFVLNLPLTRDEPNEIKNVFNELIKHLKKGAFNFSIAEKEDGDLIYEVAKEYIKQLNKELKDVYQELEAYQLLEQD